MYYANVYIPFSSSFEFYSVDIILVWQKESKQLEIKEKEVEEVNFLHTCVNIFFFSFTKHYKHVQLIDKEKKDDGKLKPAQSVKVILM